MTRVNRVIGLHALAMEVEVEELSHRMAMRL